MCSHYFCFNYWQLYNCPKSISFSVMQIINGITGVIKILMDLIDKAVEWGLKALGITLPTLDLPFINLPDGFGALLNFDLYNWDLSVGFNTKIFDFLKVFPFKPPSFPLTPAFLRDYQFNPDFGVKVQPHRRKRMLETISNDDTNLIISSYKSHPI
jgi:hypothetical protein